VIARTPRQFLRNLREHARHPTFAMIAAGCLTAAATCALNGASDWAVAFAGLFAGFVLVTSLFDGDDDDESDPQHPVAHVC
jgi:hypothetical protein